MKNNKLFTDYTQNNIIKGTKKENSYLSLEINILDLEESEITAFSISCTDVMLVLALNNKLSSENINILEGKITSVRETQKVKLFDLSKILNRMMIDELNIFSISKKYRLNNVNIIRNKEPSIVNYIEIRPQDFANQLNNKDLDFVNYNKKSLYIFRNNNFIHIKKVFNKINGIYTNICSAPSTKSHMISPLDFRLCCYLMAMFNFNYK